MKNRKLLIIGMAFLAPLSLISCATNDGDSSIASSSETSSSNSGASSYSTQSDSSSKKEKKTEEELFAIWKEGRDFALARDDNYSVTFAYDGYAGETLVDKVSAKISRGGNRFFEKRRIEELDSESGSFNFAGEMVLCFKQMTNEHGRTVYKQYEEETDADGNVNKGGAFIAPRQFEAYVEDCLPSSVFDSEGVYVDVKGDTYADFQASLLAKWNSENGIETFKTFEIVENEDDSVTLSLTFDTESVNEWKKSNDSDYLKTVERFDIKVTSDVTGIASFCRSYEEIDKFANKDDEKEKEEVTCGLKYTFDEETYNAISTETETTRNLYYGQTSFYLEGCIINYDMCLVDDLYTLDSAKAKLIGNANFLVTPSEYWDKEGELFDLYLDEEFTQPYQDGAMPEELNLYVKFNTDKGAFVEAWFKCKESITDVETGEKNTRFYEKIKIVYFVEQGNTFTTDDIFTSYDVLEVDGTAVTDGSRPSLICNEKRIYKILFDAGDTMI